MNWYKPYIKTSKRVFSVICLILLAIMLISNAVAYLYMMFAEEYFPDFVDDFLSMSSLYLFGIPAGLLLFKIIPSQPNRDKISLSFSEFIRMFSVAVLFLYVGSSAGQYFSSVVERFTGFGQTDIASEVIGTMSFWVEFPFVVLIGPFLEEVVFRKMIIDRIRPFGAKAAILFSSICFSLFHGNFSQIFYAFSVGVIFAFIYIKTGRLIYSCIMHILINFFGSYAVIWLTDGIDFNSFDASIIQNINTLQSILLCIVAVAIVLLCIYGFINFVRNYRSVSTLSSNSVSYKTVFCNFGTILFMFICIIEAVSFLILY